MSKSDTKSEKKNSTLTHVNRRKFVTGVTTTAGIGVGIGTQTRNANALVVSGTALAIGGAAIAGGLAGAYLTKKVGNYFTGDNIDAEKLKDKMADEKQTQVTQTALSMKATDDSLLRNMSNLLENAPNAAYSDAKVAAIKDLEANASESTVKQSAVDAVGNFYSTQQINLIKHYNLQIAKIENMAKLIFNETNLDNSVLQTKWQQDGETFSGFNVNRIDSETMPYDGTTSVGLVDSTSFEITQINYNSGIYYPGGDNTLAIFTDYTTFTGSDSESIAFAVKKPNGVLEKFFTFKKYRNIWDRIENQYSTVKTDIENWVTNVYPKYSTGDISTSQLVSASDIATMAGENTDNGFARTSAELAALGVEGAKHSYSIRLESDEKTVNGTVYIQNQNLSLEIGKTYSPNEFSNPIYMAIENPETGNTGTFVVEQDFTILEGVTPNGESVEQVEFRKNNQQTLDTDIAKITEELNQLAELQTKIEEQEQEVINEGTSNSGGGVFDGGNFLTENYAGIPLYLWLSGSGVILYLFQGN